MFATAEVNVMRKKFFLSAAALLPLMAVVILAVFGVSLSVWVYIVLAAVCPLVAAILWFTYKDFDKKMKMAEKQAGRRNRSG